MCLLLPAPLITPRQSLGQNFLRDPNTVRRIADAVEAAPGQGVVEIGPGTGALTGELLRRYPHLVALEVDERAIAHLRTALPALDVRRQDVLAVSWEALAAERGGPLAVVGNLPYYITSPILFGLLDARPHVSHAVVMMQREVAERLVAAPRTKAYGILSVAFQRYCDLKLLFRVPPTVFYPRPKVESAVVRLRFRPDAPPPSPFEDHLRTVIRAAFNQRRKMLRSALGAYGPVPEPWATQRAEELTSDDFEALNRALPAPA
jgi:16S rRNA (adenine1518-N6/adenine1519-N6)-dimethyltransferase